MTNPEARSSAANSELRATFRHTRHHRQNRLLAIECLDLTLLIGAEDKGPVWRRQIKADDMAYLVDEQRITRQLECDVVVGANCVVGF
ncbi:hypothetical protein CQ10_37570 [Bradyrhizobium valentinum]|nr:hypothetical protein CQ10_37570 [Bradyrhizobium valentinum]